MKSQTATAMNEGATSSHRGGCLVVQMSGQRLGTYELDGTRVTIGRLPSSDLHIDSKYVSARHAQIDFDRKGAYVVDLYSRNHTLVNGQQVDKAYLQHGDIISIGYHRLRYLADSELPSSSMHDSSISVSPDSFGAFADAVREEPDVVAAEIATQPLQDSAPPLDEMVEEMNAAKLVTRQPVDIAEVESVLEALLEDEQPMQRLVEQFESNPAGLTDALGELFEFETLNARLLMSMAPRFDLVDLPTARERRCLTLEDDGVLVAAISDPFDQNLRPWIESRCPQSLRWVLVSTADLEGFIARHEQSIKAMDEAIEVAGGSDDVNSDAEHLSLASISQDSSPIVRIVHSTLYDALKAGASDIHMEAGTSSMQIRYRIDGVLAHIATVNGRDVAEQVISRIKVMSELDIAERRIPQDGRFKTVYDGRPIDFRVSIMPSTFGEDAVLRVLDKKAVSDQMSNLSIESLGFDDKVVESLRRLSDRPYGMLLVTGPTGSGKTTTLYGAISETNSGLGKIVTIEDPVEYQLPGVLQIPVNEKKGLTFARGLRSILRHDPDKIMVGEIRDPETAQIAIQSALTGHLVFTTVHANNVFDVLSRFLHMGVDAYSFVSALNGILAQRLLRIICNNCIEAVDPTPDMLNATGVPVENLHEYKWRVGRGCGDCRGTGYRGRKAVGELLVLNDEMREAIIGRAPVRQLKELARANGVHFLRAAALELVRDGLTTMEEVDRVTTMA